MFYVGLDVHLRKIAVCILDEQGGVFKEFALAGDASVLLMRLQELPGAVAVAYEASCGYGALFDRLCGLPNVRRVEVAHPGQLRLIFRSKRKNDRVDARKLAMLLRLGEIPQVYVPSLDVRAWRGTIEFRRRLVDRCSAAKTQLRALLRTHAIAAPHRKALWSRAGRAWLAALQLPAPLAALQRDALLDLVDHLTKQVKEIEKHLNRLGRGHAGVQLLRTIPGVGPRTSEAVMAYIDQPKRFGRGKQVASYFGLVPCQDQSAGPGRLGHITKDGPATVRKLLTEAAWQGVQRSPEIRAFFERIAGGAAGRRKIALVATAHWLVRVMFALLRSGQPARFTRFARPNRKRALPTALPTSSPAAAAQTAAAA